MTPDWYFIQKCISLQINFYFQLSLKGSLIWHDFLSTIFLIPFQVFFPPWSLQDCWTNNVTREIRHQTLRPLFFSFSMQYSIVNLLDFSPWSFLTCSFFISILLGTRTGAPHHWLFPRRPPLPFSSCSTLEAAWRMYASSTFFVLRYVALHRFSYLVQPLKYINLMKKKKEGGHGASVWYLPLHMP